MTRKKQTRRCFTVEFNAETVELEKQSDRPMAAVAMELGISAKSMRFGLIDVEQADRRKPKR